MLVKMKPTWKLKSSTVPQSLVELEELLLKSRGIKDADAFFQPTKPSELNLSALGFDLEEINKACQLLHKAHQDQTPIVIFGDYDADGICATSILWRLLFDAGFKITPFIPNRMDHGYGLNEKSAQAVLQTLAPKIIITVDNGIVAHEAVAFLNKQGIQVVITDHHQPEKDKQGQTTWPKASAVLQTDQACGAGVAWLVGKLILTNLHQKLSDEDEEKLSQELDLCALATIADQVPLVGVNRSFAHWGLELLRRTTRPGLLALLEQAGVKLEQVDEGRVSYALAPRINALGRLAQGIVGVRLLCTKSTNKARELAEELNALNLERQDITQTALDLAEQQVATQIDQHLLVIYSPDFHEGVIGLIAGKLCERYYKPVIVLAGVSEVLKASARSVSGVNITELIRLVKTDLVDVGGHPLAAGFSVLSSKLKLVTDKLQALAKEQIKPELLQPTLEAECQLPTTLITLETAKSLVKYAPFGQVNPEPRFVLGNLELVSSKLVGKEGKHLKLILKIGKTDASSQQLQLLTALYWGNGHQQKHLSLGTKLNILAKLEINTWRDKSSLQAVIIDLD